MTKLTENDLKRFAEGHIGGLNTEAMAKEILELRAENSYLKQLEGAVEVANELTNEAVKKNTEWAEEVLKLRAENARLRDALQFYANPETYFGCYFEFYEPEGGLYDDFYEHPDSTLGEKPGKRALNALENVSKNSGEIEG